MTASTLLYVSLGLAPFLVSALRRRWSTGFAHHGPPGAAALALTTYALTLALTQGIVLCLTAYLGTIELFPVVHPSDWSASVLGANLRIPAWCAVGCAIVAAALLARAGARIVLSLSAVRTTNAASRRLAPSADLAVVAGASRVAFAAPAWFSRRRGRIVVSRELLAVMTVPERKALIAHERSHLRHAHHLYALVIRVAAAANPLVGDLVAPVDHACERWADRDAAAAVGDPVIVAHALGRAALTDRRAPEGALGATHSDVVSRVRDLLEPQPTDRRALIRCALLVAVSWAMTLALVAHGHAIVELAEQGLS
ncbi:M48 family metalloprotease [Flexivirga oryzae]|uniref:Beta-lactamase regulating signal transducer with metallopeptidase domain n=1 Tax=Flexivirga oryzae TaxID=1794944 RepID=A0A839N950_9MICO|nr:M48 family metalloprotease [Flexivirga oryzae]MBB2892673.1 beta-lactamase regulating signal transducer with metallopeptidase domain [Flexivirga oryzae]